MWGGLKCTVTELFYYQALFTKAGAWIWHKKLSCLILLFFCLCSKQYTFLGWREWKRDEWGACGEMCQNALMISLACLILNTLRQSTAICSAHLESSVGKRQASVWEMASFWYRADDQQSVIICDGKVQPGLKRTNAKRGVFVHCFDPMSPPLLMSGAFEDAS